MFTTTRRRRAIVAAAALALTATVAVVNAPSALAADGPYNIDGTVPDTTPATVELPDLFGGDKELGPENGNDTKIGVIHSAQEPMLDLTNPNANVDLRRAWLDTERDTTTGHDWLYFAWERDSANGSGFIAYEFMKSPAPAGCAYNTATNDQLLANCNPWENRQAGDFMILWDQQGGSRNLYLLTWSGTAPNLALSAPQLLNAAVSQAQYSANGTRGEAAVDLTATVFGGSTACLTFANTIPSTVTGNSNTADYKDTILRQAPAITNCGKVIIRKQTDPQGEPTVFNYNSTAVTNPVTPGAFTLQDDGVKEIVNVVQGTGYTITETANPAYTTTLDCSASTGVTVAISANNLVGTYNIDAASDIVDCTYTNTLRRGTITVDKVTDPSPDTTGTSFPFTASYDADGFSLTDAATPNSSGPLLPGTYSVAEQTPTGWDMTGASCSDGSAVNAISLQPGENITCQFNNQARGHIIVQKTTDPTPDPTQTSFEFDPSWGANFFLQDGEEKVSDPLVPGAYNVSEVAPTGFDLLTKVCNDDDSTDPASLTLDPGETITCVFTNQADAHIIVDKVTIPAGDPQLFDFTTNYGPAFQLADATAANDSGDLNPGTYNVSETVPEGWSGDGGSCVSSKGDAETPATVSLQAGETVICTFTNTKLGRIIVDKNVSGPNPDNQSFDFTSSYAPGSFALTDAAAPNDSGFLAPGGYSVTEDGEMNWKLINADANGKVICSDGSLNDAIALGAGETVTCTFVNEWQVGAVRVHKDAKHAAAVGGTKPLADVQFVITDQDGNEILMPLTDVNGDTCVDSFAFQTVSVHEVTPTGYADQDDQSNIVIDNVAYCDGLYGGAAEQVDFDNDPLTNVEINVTSQIDGGTKTVVVCNGVEYTTDEHGNLVLPFNNLEATAPAVTLTCTITVDP